MFQTDPQLSQAAVQTLASATEAFHRFGDEEQVRPNWQEDLCAFDLLVFALRPFSPYRGTFVNLGGKVPDVSRVIDVVIQHSVVGDNNLDSIETLKTRALDLARAHDHDHAEPVHLLMALLLCDPNSVTRRALWELNIDSTAVAINLITTHMNLNVRPKATV